MNFKIQKLTQFKSQRVINVYDFIYVIKHYSS